MDGLEVSSLLRKKISARAGNLIPFRRNGSSRGSHESGRAWLVAFSFFMVNFLIIGMGRVSGIFYVDYLEKFHISRRLASTPYSVQRATSNLFGPVVGILGQLFSVRALTMTGGLMAAISAVGCAFAPNILWVTIFWGDFYGIATAFATTLNQAVINMYFQKNRSSASGLSYAGSSLGAIMLPFLVDDLLDKWGYRETYLMMAILLLLVIPVAIFTKNPSRKREDDAELIEYQAPERNNEAPPGGEKLYQAYGGESPQSTSSSVGGEKPSLKKMVAGADLASKFGSLVSASKYEIGASRDLLTTTGGQEGVLSSISSTAKTVARRLFPSKSPPGNLPDLYQNYDDERTPLNPRGVLGPRRIGFLTKVFSPVVKLLKEMFIEPTDEDDELNAGKDKVVGEGQYQQVPGSSGMQEDFDVVVVKSESSAVMEERQYQGDIYRSSQTGCTICLECGKPVAPPTYSEFETERGDLTSVEVNTLSGDAVETVYGPEHSSRSSSNGYESYRKDYLTSVSERDESQSFYGSPSSQKSLTYGTVGKIVMPSRSKTDTVVTAEFVKEPQPQKFFEERSKKLQREGKIPESTGEPQSDVYSEEFSQEIEKDSSKLKSKSSITSDSSVKRSSRKDATEVDYSSEGKFSASPMSSATSATKISMSKGSKVSSIPSSSGAQTKIRAIRTKTAAGVDTKQNPSIPTESEPLVEHPRQMLVRSGSRETRSEISSMSTSADPSISEALQQEEYTVTEIGTDDEDDLQTRAETIERPEGLSTSKRLIAKRLKTVTKSSPVSASISSGEQTTRFKISKTGKRIVQGAEFEQVQQGSLPIEELSSQELLESQDNEEIAELQREISEIAATISTLVESSTAATSQETESQGIITDEDDPRTRTFQTLKGEKVLTCTKTYSTKSGEMFSESALAVDPSLSEGISTLTGSSVSVRPQITESECITKTDAGDETSTETGQFIEGSKVVTSTTKKFIVKGGKMLSESTGGEEFSRTEVIEGSDDEGGETSTRTVQFIKGPKVVTSTTKKILVKGEEMLTETTGEENPSLEEVLANLRGYGEEGDGTLTRTVQLIKGPKVITSTTKKYIVKGGKMITESTGEEDSSLSEVIAVEGSDDEGEETSTKTVQFIKGPKVVTTTTKKYIVKGGKMLTESTGEEGFSQSGVMSTLQDLGDDGDETSTRTVQFLKGPKVVTSTTKKYIVKGGKMITESTGEEEDSSLSEVIAVEGSDDEGGETSSRAVQFIKGPKVVTTTTKKYIVKGGKMLEESTGEEGFSQSEVMSTLQDLGDGGDETSTRTVQFLKGPKVVTSTIKKYIVKGGKMIPESTGEEEDSSLSEVITVEGSDDEGGETSTSAVKFIKRPKVVTTTTKKYIVKGGKMLTESTGEEDFSQSEVMSTLQDLGDEGDETSTRTVQFIKGPKVVTSTTKKYIVKGGKMLEESTGEEGFSQSEVMPTLQDLGDDSNETSTRAVQFIKGPKVVTSTIKKYIVKGGKMMTESTGDEEDSSLSEVITVEGSDDNNETQTFQTIKGPTVVTSTTKTYVVKSGNASISKEDSSAFGRIIEESSNVLEKVEIEQDPELEVVAVPLGAYSRQFVIRRGSQEVEEYQRESSTEEASKYTRAVEKTGIPEPKSSEGSSKSKREVSRTSSVEKFSTQEKVFERGVTSTPKTVVNVVEKSESSVKSTKGTKRSKKKETEQMTMKSTSTKQKELSQYISPKNISFLPRMQNLSEGAILPITSSEVFPKHSINFRFLYQNLNFIIHIIRIAELLQSGESYSPQRFQSLFSEKSELRKALKFFFGTIEETTTNVGTSQLSLFKKDSAERQAICKKINVNEFENEIQDFDENFRNQYIYNLLQMVFEENESAIASNFPEQDQEHVLRIIMELKKLVQHCFVLESRYSVTQTVTLTGGSETSKQKLGYKTSTVAQTSEKQKSSSKSSAKYGSLPRAVEDRDSSAERSVYLYCSDHSFQAVSTEVKVVDSETPAPTDSPPVNILWKQVKVALWLHTNLLFLLVCLCRVVHFFVFTGLLAIIIDFATDRGLYLKESLFLISALSLGDLIGRLCSGWITDMGVLSIERFMAAMMILQGILSMGFNWASPKHLYLICMMFSMCEGATYVRHPVLMCKYTKGKEHSVGLGFINFVAGIVGFGMPRYIGYFRDTLGSYKELFQINGTISIAFGVLWSLVPFYLRLISRRNHTVN